jgi:hypothetical protein
LLSLVVGICFLGTLATVSRGASQAGQLIVHAAGAGW